MFGGVGSWANELGRAGAHALSGGITSELQGGNFWQGALSGGLSSGLGSGIGVIPGAEPGYQVLGGVASGGIGSAISGGSFFQGAGQGLMVGAFNHAMHNRGDPPWDLNGDGKLSLHEAKEWYNNADGKPVELQLSNIDLQDVYASEFDGVGDVKSFNLQTMGSKDGIVLGNITLKLKSFNTVAAYYDRYDFEMHNWNNPKNWIRNFETIGGRVVNGKGTPFTIKLLGTARISTTRKITRFGEY